MPSFHSKRKLDNISESESNPTCNSFRFFYQKKLLDSVESFENSLKLMLTNPILSHLSNESVFFNEFPKEKNSENENKSKGEIIDAFKGIENENQRKFFIL